MAAAGWAVPPGFPLGAKRRNQERRGEAKREEGGGGGEGREKRLEAGGSRETGALGLDKALCQDGSERPPPGGPPMETGILWDKP